VIVIIGGLAGMLTLVGRDDQGNRLETESKRLYQVMRALNDEAAFAGQELGLWIEADGYRASRYDLQVHQWVALDDRKLADYRFPEAVRVELSLEGNALRLVKRGDEEEDELTRDEEVDATPVGPDILFLSSGESTAVTLVLSLEGYELYSAGGDGGAGSICHQCAGGPSPDQPVHPAADLFGKQNLCRVGCP